MNSIHKKGRMLLQLCTIIFLYHWTIYVFSHSRLISCNDKYTETRVLACELCPQQAVKKSPDDFVLLNTSNLSIRKEITGLNRRTRLQLQLYQQVVKW